MKIKRPPQKFERKDTLEDDLYAMLAVLSQRDADSDSCPSEKELADFSDGRLKGQKRKKIMAHLNECFQCRRQWIRLRNALDAAEERRYDKFALFINKLRNFKLNYTLVGGGCGAALAACLLLYFSIFGQNTLQTMILKSYADLSPSQIAHYNSFASKGENRNAEASNSKAMLAYQHGLKSAKESLLNNSGALSEMSYQDKRQHLTVLLGQWVVMLQCTCLSSEASSAEFWSDQEAISGEFQEELQNAANTEGKTREIMTAVTAIQQAVKGIRETGLKFTGCNDITYAIANLENTLR